MSRCLYSPPLCHAAILYVQVEGEAAIAEETLQQTDSVQTVVKRAAEADDIERIAWKDVAGWELRASRDKGAKQVASGTSSEPLLDLPDFPSKSLLIITRRPAAATSHLRASPPAPLSVAAIVADNPPPLKDGVRKSWPIQDELRLSDTTRVDAFPFYLPFVNRREQCDECVECFRQQFDAVDAANTDFVTQDNALKYYKVVVSAGGPGIGQSCSASRACSCSNSCPAALRSPLTHQRHCVVCVCVSTMLGVQARQHGPGSPSLVVLSRQKLSRGVPS
jgi:hypothetical protein